MIREKELTIPSSYSILNGDEMEKIYGGSVHLPVSRDYLNKEYCKGYGLSLLGQKLVTGMTVLEVAQELYAHAVAYYTGDKIKGSNKISSSVKNYLINKGKIIDIDDGGDTAIRKAGYAVIWNTL